MVGHDDDGWTNFCRHCKVPIFMDWSPSRRAYSRLNYIDREPHRCAEAAAKPRPPILPLEQVEDFGSNPVVTTDHTIPRTRKVSTVEKIQGEIMRSRKNGVVLLDRRLGAVAPGNTRFILHCEKHGFFLDQEKRMPAEALMYHPERWCAEPHV